MVATFGWSLCEELGQPQSLTLISVPSSTRRRNPLSEPRLGVFGQGRAAAVSCFPSPHQASAAPHPPGASTAAPAAAPAPPCLKQGIRAAKEAPPCPAWFPGFWGGRVAVLPLFPRAASARKHQRGLCRLRSLQRSAEQQRLRAESLNMHNLADHTVAFSCPLIKRQLLPHPREKKRARRHWNFPV